MKLHLPAGWKDWRTTALGGLQATNALVMAVQAFQAEHSGLVFIEPKLWGRFLLIGAVLKAVQGVITPSSAKIQQKSAELEARVEQKVTTAMNS